MLKVVSTKYVKEENLKEFLLVAENMVQHTLTEDGCISYEMKKDRKEADRWAFLEQWESEEKLNAHLSTDFLKENSAKLNALTYKKGDLMIF